MFHALIQSYADAMYVATTLRPPLSPPSACVSERFAGSDACEKARPSGPLAGPIVQWLLARLGRGFGATAAPHLRSLPKI
jgi:hypothetical protein